MLLGCHFKSKNTKRKKEIIRMNLSLSPRKVLINFKAKFHKSKFKTKFIQKKMDQLLQYTYLQIPLIFSIPSRLWHMLAFFNLHIVNGRINVPLILDKPGIICVWSSLMGHLKNVKVTTINITSQVTSLSSLSLPLN